MPNRIHEVDFARGIAVIMMVVFHFTWDLDYFDIIDGSSVILQKMTGGLFVFLVGISLTLSRSNPIVHGVKIFGYGMIITILSYFFAKESFVFFGILHFIGISIIISAPFIRKKYTTLVLGIAIFAMGFWLDKINLDFPWLVWVWHNYSVNTLDLYPLFPWLGIVFLGIFTGNILYPNGKSFLRKRISIPIEFLGKNSLLLYFLHLPVVFLVAYLLSITI